MDAHWLEWAIKLGGTGVVYAAFLYGAKALVNAAVDREKTQLPEMAKSITLVSESLIKLGDRVDEVVKEYHRQLERQMQQSNERYDAIHMRYIEERREMMTRFELMSNTQMDRAGERESLILRSLEPIEAQMRNVSDSLQLLSNSIVNRNSASTNAKKPST